jgi:hypothetical protein
MMTPRWIFVPATAGTSLLLDNIDDISLALGLRKLITSYSGYACRVERSNDYVEVEVSFDSNDEVSLDSAVTEVVAGSTNATTLGEFVAASGYTDVDSLGSADSAYCSILYDQNGNYDVSQSTIGDMPRLINSGTLETQGGKPTLYFDGSNYLGYYDTDGQLVNSSSGDYMAFAIAKTTVPDSNDMIFDQDNFSSHRIAQFFRTVSTGSGRFGTIGFYGGSYTSIKIDSDSNLNVLQCLNDGSDVYIYKNDTDSTSDSVSSNNTSAYQFRVGCSTGDNGSLWNGYISEIICIAAANQTDRATIRDNQMSYVGIS